MVRTVRDGTGSRRGLRPAEPAAGGSPASRSWRRWRSPATLWAQETPAPTAGGSLGAGSAGVTPLARYFPKDNLIFYFEFSGVDAHADAWNKTAAYKMLTETPLGEMLEEVGAQLLDKGLSYSPGHKLDGKQIITLLKHAAQHGFAIGVHMKPVSRDG